MAKTHRSKKQKIYKMVGCSKKTRKHHLGGTKLAGDTTLAYTGKPIFSYPNPNLAYTGKGGQNPNALNPALPNTGPVSNGNNTIFNSALSQTGGSCSSCSLIAGTTTNMTGGSCSLCSLTGGSNRKHRKECKCSSCKKRNMTGGNPGIPYPNGLVGDSWTPNVNTWPGVDGVPGNSNHYALNTYHNDISRQMVTNPPIKGGRKRKQKGGTLSNFLSQDLINLGRQFQFGVGTAYNALAGYSAPVNPLPWKDQFSR